MKYHHLERCFTYRMKRPRVNACPSGRRAVEAGKHGRRPCGDRFHGTRGCALWCFHTATRTPRGISMAAWRIRSWLTLRADLRGAP